jgi:hypothetical protein
MAHVSDSINERQFMLKFTYCKSVTLTKATSLEYLQTRRVSQTTVVRYREIGGRLCTKHGKKIVWFLPKEYYYRNKTFFQHFVDNLPPPISLLRNTMVSETRRVCTLKMSLQVSHQQTITILNDSIIFFPSTIGVNFLKQQHIFKNHHRYFR